MLRIVAVLGVFWASAASAEVSVAIHYLRQEVEAPPTLSGLDPIPEDDGVRGAELGLADNATTGQFLGHAYTLEVTSVAPGGDILAAARAALAETGLLVLDAPAATLLAIADLPEAEGALIFNAAAEDEALRSEDCRANVLHVAPSLTMRTDALMQFLLQRRWTTLALITGTLPEDLAYAEALRRSAVKFQVEIAVEKTWAFDADMRRNASQEVPLFTQDLPPHDILLVADEWGDFARFVMFNTWEPKLVAGSEGMSPVAWSPVLEQWGAAQLQGRFVDLAGRGMRPRDYAAWAAVRSIGEAVTRTGAADAATLRAFLLSDDFELAGFKGRPLTFRAWNGQLRQPIPIVHPRALVAMAPLEGFLHQRSELDTLGLDQPESACTAFGG
ncbi:MAG: ABC transporter substrate-binding protein [Rhodobacteraceae bacterium]|jgi:ABC transporter substrate binding protein (PQQ-dependent alcohol dehydrogenase system)|nr:ABC transporter substrate-binding protein [Paracoccaceae bacterium]